MTMTGYVTEFKNDIDGDAPLLDSSCSFVLNFATDLGGLLQICM